MTNKDLLLALIVNIFWAFNFVAAKYGLAHFPAFLFTALRFLLLLILLAPLLRPVPGHTRRLLLIGLVMGIGHFSLMFWGMSVSSDVSSIAIASQLYVPFSTLLAVLFLSETIRWRRTLGMVVAFLGVMVIGFDPAVLDNLVGLLLVAGAALAMAAANIFISQLRGQVKPLALQVWVALIAMPGLLILSLIFEQGQWQALRSAGLLEWSSVAYSTIGASVIGHGVLAYLLGRYPVSTVSPFMLLTPVFAVTFGVTIWGDQLTWQLLLGGGMTLVGVAIIALRSARKLDQSKLGQSR